MKICLACKIEKDEKEFNKCFKNKTKTKFYFRSNCKECDRAINKKYCQEHKEILAEKRKLRIKTEREKIGVAVHHGFAVVDKEEVKRRESCRRKAIGLRKKGIIKIFDYCQFCGIRNMNLEMHHADYNFPENVIFLCRPCHLKMHWKVLNNK